MGKKKGKGKVTKAVKQYVKRVMKDDIEIKQFGASVSAITGITDSGSTRYGLTYGMSQGTSSLSRIGNKIKIYGIQFACRIKAYQGTGATPVPENIRVVIVKDTKTTGVVPSISEIFNDTTSGNLVYSSYTVSLRQAKQYKILYDKVLQMHVEGGTTNYATWHNFKWVKKFKTPMVVNFYEDTAVTTIAGVQDNQISIYFISASATSTDVITQNITYAFDYQDA